MKSDSVGSQLVVEGRELCAVEGKFLASDWSWKDVSLGTYHGTALLSLPLGALADTIQDPTVASAV